MRRIRASSSTSSTDASAMSGESREEVRHPGHGGAQNPLVARAGGTVTAQGAGIFNGGEMTLDRVTVDGNPLTASGQRDRGQHHRPVRGLLTPGHEALRWAP